MTRLKKIDRKREKETENIGLFNTFIGGLFELLVEDRFEIFIV